MSTSFFNTLQLQSKSNVSIFEIPHRALPNIKHHIYISKKATKELANYSMPEFWGNDNILLYKYLDYIWRFQLIDKQVKVFINNNNKRLVFHTGLHNKHNQQPIYLCLIENKTNNMKYEQGWRVSCNESGFNQSFLTKNDLLFKFNLNEFDIPIRTNFFKNKKDAIYCQEYSFVIHLYLAQIKQKIEDVIPDHGLTSNELNSRINESIEKSIYNVRHNPSLVGRQVFMERDLINEDKVTNGYHLELLIPIVFELKSKYGHFAIVLRPKHKKKQYIAMSVITREMAYSNSRLIAPIILNWLKPFKNTSIKQLSIQQPTISTTQQQQMPINIIQYNNYINQQRNIIQQQKMISNNNNNNNNNNGKLSYLCPKNNQFKCPAIHPHLCIDCILSEYTSM